MAKNKKRKTALKRFEDFTNELLINLNLDNELQGKIKPEYMPVVEKRTTADLVRIINSLGNKVIDKYIGKGK